MLGAGLQGVSVALALAAAGYRVTLVDRAPDCLLRASLRNEGKIHLGFVYANDPSLRTSSLMLEGALAFGPRLEALLGLPVRWSDLVAHPFMYVVMRDSLVAPDRILHTWDRLQGVYEDACRTGDAAPYLGTRPSRLWRETSSTTGVRASFGDEAALTVETAELAIDPARLRDLGARASHRRGARELPVRP